MTKKKINLKSGSFSLELPSGAAAMLFILIILGTVSLARADSPTRLGLVIEHGDGEIIKQCIEISEDEVSSYEILEQAGLDLNVELSGGMGAAVCRIDHEGCTYPEEECFCHCSGGGTCEFWSYWLLEGETWRFSGRGASGVQVQDGDVQAWKWGNGTAGGASPPPLIPFDEICEPLVTDTPTPTPTPPPTETPTSTPTPEPTATPEPQETPVIHYFSADQTTITAGQPVLLSWDLSDAEEAYLRYNGSEEGVVSPGSKTVSPSESTVYTLAARNEGGESTLQLSITVNEAPPTPTAASTPVPAAAPAIAAAAPAAPSPTSIPAPVISFSAASLTLPQGACTNLQWSARHAESLFLADEPVQSQGTRSVCPAQSQTYRLRAVYPGGEKTAELSLTVTEAPIPPSDPPSPTATPSAAAIQTPPAAATPAAMAVSAVVQSTTPAGPRRFTVSTASQDRASTGIWWTAGVAAVMGLFVVVPLGLIVTGWVAWWLKGKKR